MRRVIIIVINSLGIGAMPDADRYGDTASCNTLSNVASFNGGLRLPNLQRLGLGNLASVMGVPPATPPLGSFARMLEKSAGKDTTTGHWELAGLVLETPFQVFPGGFPEPVMTRFLSECGCGGQFGNVPASGTEIIAKYNADHKRTGWPIVYTSADSVFQIACNVAVISLDKLYEWCEIARAILNDGYNVSRVIARPYEEREGKLSRLSAHRRDYALPPPARTLLDSAKEAGVRVLGIGKIEDIFAGRGLTHSVHHGSNKEGLDYTLSAVARSLDLSAYRLGDEEPAREARELVFVNLVDTDSLYGHRNDVAGYGAALEEIDTYIGKLLDALTEDDLLLITADHGCDPTQPGTDHTREIVPLLFYNRAIPSEDLGVKPSFTYLARRAAEWLGMPVDPAWAL